VESCTNCKKRVVDEKENCGKLKIGEKENIVRVPT
jgi:hypothetical protein